MTPADLIIQNHLNIDLELNMLTGLAKLNHDVVFGRSGGRIIWQPRIGCWLTDKQFAGVPLPAPYTNMTLPQIYRSLGCSNRVYDYNACFKAVEDPAVRFSSQKLNATDTEHVVETPVGRQVAVHRAVTTNVYHITLKWPIETVEELNVATWRAQRRRWQWDQAVFEDVQRTWGDLGAPTMFVPRVNVQDLYINTMGIENATYMMVDEPEAVQTYFHALDESHDRLIDVINASPIDIINFGDNLHGGTLPPRLFREFVLPAYLKRSQRLHAAGKFVHSHWDGDTKPLLPFARTCGLDGIEAITPEPQGDVTLDEVKAALGDEIFLLDGIPAVYFDKTFAISVLKECVHRLIELFAPRLVLGISDELSSTGDIERIRVVGEIVDAYNASCRAGIATVGSAR